MYLQGGTSINSMQVLLGIFLNSNLMHMFFLHLLIASFQPYTVNKIFTQRWKKLGPYLCPWTKYSFEKSTIVMISPPTSA